MSDKFFNTKIKNQNNRAFTLIELLVVVAIIGILSSVVLASLNTARAKARDARRISDLRQIRIALEAYFADNGYYPPSGCGWDCNAYYFSSDSSWDTFKGHLSPYMANLPKDPINSSGCGPWTDGCYSYSYGNVLRNSSSPNYDLVTQFEDKNNLLRCEIKGYKIVTWGYWCGPYSKYMYDAYQ